ncbi:MAG TPA: fused MFS/spermidine synthase [Candidatus Eremiobacteraceae bacterium]|nr:fused MFS/spermidine synthase [Candidatus Eremiobacteraceae bacterium]
MLYSLTVALGAFLLFLLEPLFAKMILPRFGGSAAVWSTCLVFFQSALLLGYYYADVLTRRLSAARQASTHIAFMVVSLALLPIAPHAILNSSSSYHPAFHILVLLSASIGLPFVLLSATSPLIQAWKSRTGGAAYHLFAISNFASFIALLSFPFLVEPRLSSHLQAQLWSALYALFVMLCSLTAWMSRSESADATPVVNAEIGQTTQESAVTAGVEIRSSRRDWLLWLALSACGSVILLATTNLLTEDVAPVPLLWVLPLALYLLTFTMAFSRRSLYSRWLMARLVAVLLGSLGYAIYDPSFTESVQVAVPLFCLGLFVCCLFCHGELARLRPAPERLTTFYLVVAAGGALGAIFVGLIAPVLFSATYEYPLALCFTALAAAAVLWDTGWMSRAFWTVGTAALVAVLAYHTHAYEQNSILVARNFYGGLRVQLHNDWLKRPYHTLYHGQIEHGAQYLDPPKNADPTTYYARNSGVGLALDFFKQPSRHIGVVGLGTGTIAAYSNRGDELRYYEINPLILKIANEQFSYLQNARTNGVDVAIRMGDARLSLASDETEQFDVLVIDAFSGDAIPVHLLTREALALYLQRLKPNGILAIHTSNTYLDLNPVVKLLADDAGIESRLISNSDDQRKLIDAADWMLLTRNQGFLLKLDETVLQDSIDMPTKLRVWTDDYNNLFQILRPLRFLNKGTD